MSLHERTLNVSLSILKNGFKIYFKFQPYSEIRSAMRKNDKSINVGSERNGVLTCRQKRYTFPIVPNKIKTDDMPEATYARSG